MQYKTSEVAARCKGLVRVNIYKNQIKNATHLPALPHAQALSAALAPHYWTLNSIGRDKSRSRPVYVTNDAQRLAAGGFLKVGTGLTCIGSAE